MPSPAASDGTEERRRRPEKEGASNIESTNRLAKIKQQKQFRTSAASYKSKQPSSLFPDPTSHIEIHDEAPVNVASLFFKILQTITGLPTFRSFALNPT